MILPSHIAIIMDGNGRWGLNKYNDRNKGHYYGLQNINKVIEHCINLKPLVDGQLLRIAIPKFTEERRKELIKILKTIAEKAKVAIRNIRRDSLEELKKEQKDNNLSEDDLKKNSNEVQKITDLKIAEIDKKLSEKEVEILKV